MKFYKGIILISWSVILLCVPAHAEIVDKIIAVVNDDVITLSEFNAAFEPYRKNIENTYKGNDKEAVIKTDERWPYFSE